MNMFDTDLLIAFGLMAVLFLRQIVILKQPNKINYAPLMIGIGALSSIIHFMIHPDSHDILLILRESFLPLLIALFLYIIMNILHQTQQSMHTKIQDQFIQVLVREINELKSFILELEKRMAASQSENIKTQEEIRQTFIEDIAALDSIKDNQVKFLQKFEELEEWHADVNKSFNYFSQTQLPELDDVVHKHIDILRISEQDHYNKLQDLLKKALENRVDITEDIKEVNEKLESIKDTSDSIATTIIQKTLNNIATISKAFENEILLLKSNAATISTTLSENETLMQNIKSQSEMIMKQMILSSKKMDELEKKNSGLSDVFHQAKSLLDEVEAVKSDYVKAQSQLNTLASSLQKSIEEEHEKLREKIDTSLEELHKHYHIVGEDVTKNANLLAKKAQVQKGYTELDS
jgi:ABC-type transporter Mla subunit MlaD